MREYGETFSYLYRDEALLPRLIPVPLREVEIIKGELTGETAS